jgi:hypothetical protein
MRGMTGRLAVRRVWPHPPNPRRTLGYGLLARLRTYRGLVPLLVGIQIAFASLLAV